MVPNHREGISLAFYAVYWKQHLLNNTPLKTLDRLSRTTEDIMQLFYSVCGTLKIGSVCLTMNLFFLCSGSPGRRDERSPVLLHPPFLHPRPGCAGSDRADRLWTLEGKQTQTFLLIREQWMSVCFQNMCFLINIGHNNAKTAIALLNHTIKLTQWTTSWVWSPELREHKQLRWTGEEIVNRWASCEIFFFFFVCVMEDRWDKTSVVECFVLRIAHLNLKHSAVGLQYLH